MRKGNFDITHELDEFLMVEKPLTATKRKQNVDLDKLGPEYRQLEEQYVSSFLSFLWLSSILRTFLTRTLLPLSLI